MKDVKTIRWSISSTQLSAGKNYYIHDIQCQIVYYYNKDIRAKLNNPQLMLQEHHTNMIKITVDKMHFKGKEQIVIEFIDHCDMVSQMYFKPGSSPFEERLFPWTYTKLKHQS